MSAKVILKIADTEIFYEGGRCWFYSDLDICNDGSGSAHGDPHFRPMTAYYNKGKYLNAGRDPYIVVPPQLRKHFKPTKIMGCKAQLTHTTAQISAEGLVGEIGPPNKTGEAAYCLAKIVNPKITHNSGDKRRIYLYEFWPGIPALINGKAFALE